MQGAAALGNESKEAEGRAAANGEGSNRGGSRSNSSSGERPQIPRDTQDLNGRAPTPTCSEEVMLGRGGGCQ